MKNKLRVTTITYTRIILKTLNKVLLNLNDCLYFLIIFVETVFLNFKNENNKFKIITASDSSHFNSLCQLLDSLINFCSSDHLVLYDLGLTNNETLHLVNNYPSVKILKFKFDNYPKHVSLKERDAGAYAWKPIIIFEELQKDNLPTIWMDAGNLVFKNLKYLKKYIYKKKFYSPYSSGHIQKWTHPDTITSLNLPDKFLKKRNLNAAIIGVNFDEEIYDLMESWRNLALKKEIIIPDGSSKSNHRHDQSLLTILYYIRINYFLKIKTYKLWGVDIQQDID